MPDDPTPPSDSDPGAEATPPGGPAAGGEGSAGADEVDAGRPDAEIPVEASELPDDGSEGRLAITGVYLLTAGDDGAEMAVPDMGLVVDGHGVAVWKPDRTLAALLPWENLDRLSAKERSKTPDDRVAVIVEAVTPVKTHRFVVPTDDPGGLQAAVAGLAGAHRKSGRKGPSPALIGALLVVVAIGVAVAILAATGAL